MRKRYLLLILTLFFGLALLAVDRYTQDFTRPGLSEQQSHEADYYGKQLYSRQYDASGRLSQTFTAAESTHYPQTRSTLFSRPVVVTTDADGDTWQVTAAEGTLSDHEHLLHLQQNVEIRPQQPQDNDNLLIRTNSLTYNDQTQIATTADPVTITSTRTTLTAVGMSMDIPRQHLEFNAQVNTRYVP